MRIILEVQLVQLVILEVQFYQMLPLLRSNVHLAPWIVFAHLEQVMVHHSRLFYAASSWYLLLTDQAFAGRASGSLPLLPEPVRHRLELVLVEVVIKNDLKNKTFVGIKHY